MVSVLHSSATSSLSDIFISLAESDVGKFTLFFRRLREDYPHEAILLSLKYLSGHELDTAARQITVWLSGGDRYLAVLLDPDLLSSKEAGRAAAILRDTDREFFSKLSQRNEQNQTSPRLIGQALSILEDLGDLTLLVPWLRMLTRHRDERIRSKAVKILCKARPNKELIARQLQSEDPRARANAVEAMWNTETPEALDVFHSALHDPNHRVVANALVGLYIHEEQSAITRITELGNHPSPAFRAAAAWALGQIRDRRGLPALAALAKDASPQVRKGALKSLTLFPAEGGEQGL